MIRAYRSAVISAPVQKVWAAIRDFNALPAWHPAIVQSEIERGLASDAIGCVRSFSLQDGGHLREQLLALSDVDHSFTYNILASPMPVKNYVATFRLTPITVGNRTFAEWWADFDVTAGGKEAMAAQIGDGVFVAGSKRWKRRSPPRAVLRIIRAKLPNSKPECIAMKLGFNLLLWTTHVVDEHTPLFDRLKVTGYDGVEIPLFEGEVSHYQRLGRTLKEAGLGASAVTVLPSGKSAIAAAAAERALAHDHLKWAIDCTAALGANVLCGPFHQPLGEFSGTGPTEVEKSHCIEVHKQAAQYAARSGIALSVEPLNRFECYFLNTANDAQALVERVDEPNYGYLYDTFHLNIEEKNLTKAIRATASAINHVHISENDRGTPGTGHVDFAAVLAALKQSGYDGWLTVEAFGQALPDLAAATKIWRPLFLEPEDVYQGAFRLMRESWDQQSR